PGGAVAQPVVGSLLLRPVLDLLLEKPEFVVDPVTVSRHPQGCEGIKEARGQPSEAAITERCVRLLFQDVFQVKTHLAYCFLAGVVNPQIPQVVRKEAAEQKLHGKIVEPFGAMTLIPILSCEGGLTEIF